MGEEGPDLYTLPLSEFRKRASIGQAADNELLPVRPAEVPVPSSDVSVQPGPHALGNRSTKQGGE
jgi:hypothetical protein